LTNTSTLVYFRVLQTSASLRSPVGTTIRTTKSFLVEVTVALMNIPAKRILVVAISALAIAFAGSALNQPVDAASCPQGKACVLVSVDNQNGNIPATGNHLFLTLFGAGSDIALISPSGVSYGLAQSMRYDELLVGTGTRAQFTLTMSPTAPLSSGRLYFSESNLGGVQPPAQASFRYDYVEFTIIVNGSSIFVNGDVSGIDQVGIPSRLQFEDGHGTPLPGAGTTGRASRQMGCWTHIMEKLGETPISGWRPSSAEITSPSGSRIRIAGPSNMPGGMRNYPSMRGYLDSMVKSNREIRISGYFAGNKDLGLQPTYYDYRGSFDSHGNLTLSGTLSDSRGGSSSSNYPVSQTMYLPARAFFDAMAPVPGWDESTWGDASVGFGTGFGVYAQNGPYQLGGVKPTTFEIFNDGSSTLRSWKLDAKYLQDAGVFKKSIDNDVYGWIYGDLVASMGNGFFGDQLGYETSAWNTNKDAQGKPFAAKQEAFSALWPQGNLPDFAAWNVYQQAIATTSDSYGMSLGDRFAFASAPVDSPDMATDVHTAEIAIVLLPDDGCAAPVGIGPNVQSLLLSVDSPSDSVIVRPAGQQPPEGVYHDYVTPTAIGFTPTSYTLDGELPAGLTLNPSTGVVSGTATEAMDRGTYTLIASDGKRSATMTLHITVREGT
jgi:hypothetical protein